MRSTKGFDDQITIDSRTSLSIKTLDNSTFYFADFSLFGLKFKLQINRGLFETKEQIGFGDPLHEVRNKYPEVQKGRISHTSGSYLIAYQKGLIFKCDTRDKVKSWGIFSF